MWFRTIAKNVAKRICNGRAICQYTRWFPNWSLMDWRFSPNLHWWKVTISMPGRSSRAWTRGIFHELAPVGCSNANTPLIPSRYSITKRAKLKRRFASRHLRLKRETEASRFQTWNWSKQVSGGSPPTRTTITLQNPHFRPRPKIHGPWYAVSYITCIVVWYQQELKNARIDSGASKLKWQQRIKILNCWKHNNASSHWHSLTSFILPILQRQIDTDVHFTKQKRKSTWSTTAAVQ